MSQAARMLEDLEMKLTVVSPALVNFVHEIDGDILVLGAGGKMGPSLAKLARRAFEAAGVSRKVVAVSRFSSNQVKAELGSAGVETIEADLMDEEQLWSLPEAPNIIYMAGQKFGTTGREQQTWALNTYLPGRVALRYRRSRIVAFSSGNVYPFVSVESRGSKETDPPGPIGEYAQSRLGGERILQYFSLRNNTPMVILRLNYAVELRYGVLHDVAWAVLRRTPIDLRMGYVNVIWQGDANEVAIRALGLASVPPTVLNVTGPEKISVRWLAAEFGRLFGVEPIFVNSEEDTALLSDASKAHEMFGYPRVRLDEMIRWVAEWVRSNGPSLNRPTHFQEREGRF